MIDINKLSEGIDYTIEKLDFFDNSQAWKASIISAPFKGLNLIFSNVQYDGGSNHLRYKLIVLDNYMQTLETTDEIEDYSFRVIEDIIRNGLVSGSVVLDDTDSNN